MIDTFSIRCSILRLAFSGKLTIQLEEDGSASNIFERIKSKKPVETIEEGPYQIPSSWVWARLSDLYNVNPKVEADNETEAAFIPMERISGGFNRTFSFKKQKWEKASKNHTKFADGDVAFAKITPCFENRKSFIAHDLPNGIGGGTTELIILRQRDGSGVHLLFNTRSTFYKRRNCIIQRNRWSTESAVQCNQELSCSCCTIS